MQTNLVSVKPVEVNDAPTLFKLLDHDREALKQWMPWAETTLTVADEENFMQFGIDQREAGKLYLHTIRYDGKIVGMIDLHNIDSMNQRGELGYWLSSSVQGHGIMTEAVRLVCQMGFQILNLHKLTIEADVVNQVSRAVATRSNFVFEGILIDHILVAGEYHDVAVYALINPSH